LLDPSRFAAKTVDLRPPGQARFDVMAESVIGDQLLVFGIMRRGVRPWTDQRHVTADHVEQLRQFVDARSPKPTTQPCHAWIVPRRLLDHEAILVDMHGAELEDVERLAVE